MSIERYIIRSEDTQSERINYKNYSAETLFMIMKELYKFKDEIGYNSWLYIITTDFENTPVRNPNNGNICFSYIVNNNIARRYWDATHSESSNYVMNSKYYTVPRAVLLINEKNECRYIELSTNLIHRLLNIQESNYINLGRMIFAIDITYDPRLNQICTVPDTKSNDTEDRISNSVCKRRVLNVSTAYVEDTSTNHIDNIELKVPIDLIPFISKNIPSINNYNIYSEPPNYITEFIKKNLEDIKKDLLIEEPKINEPTIQYVKINTLLSEEKAKRKAELLEELRKLEESD